MAVALQTTMNMLAQAQQVCGSTEGQDEDMVDYINVLRESVLDAYSGIVQVGRVDDSTDLPHCSYSPMITSAGDDLTCITRITAVNGG